MDFRAAVVVDFGFAFFLKAAEGRGGLKALGGMVVSFLGKSGVVYLDRRKCGYLKDAFWKTRSSVLARDQKLTVFER